NSASDLANAIQKVLQDTHLRGELIRAGLERSQQFSWSRTAELTRSVYEEAIDRFNLSIR
ncbi:MAG TPA: hypothetical protein VIV66_04765, partial [Pyrinomonadaceae bacterium]